MTKKCMVFIFIMIFITIFTSSIIRFAYANIIKNDDTIALTKNSQFDIIDNIGSIILTSMTTLGEKNLSTQSKIDATIMYILYNKDKYSEHIVDNDNKIRKEDFYNILSSLFDCSEIILDEYIDVSIGNINYSYLKDYDIVKIEELNNSYVVYTKYCRTLSNVKNYVYVKYELTRDMKIKDVNIIESIVV